MQISKELFRKYDLRGIYPSELNEEAIEVIGKALGSIFIERGIKSVVIGRDNRSTSEQLARSFINGLLSTGCNITYTGITVQPAIHFFSFDKKFDAAVNLTASHNPKNYNGLKIDYSNARPFFDEDINKLYQRCISNNFVSGRGSYTEEDLNNSYIDFITSRFNFDPNYKIKVLVYCGNGATSLIAPMIMEKLGISEIPIFCEYDGSFPHGVPDPESMNLLKDLSTRVLQQGADLGIAYDGDGDRFGVVDEKGTIYGADELLMLFSKDVLKSYGPTNVLYDVKSTQLLDKVIKENGGIPKMLRTGRAYFLEYMLGGNATLGAELSGHFYFGDEYFGYDDGIYTSCRLLKILCETKRSLHDLMSKFPKPVNTPEIKVTCADALKFEIVEKIKDYIKENVTHMELIDIDGARVLISDTGWFLIRASNTSNYLSLRIEGKDHLEVDKIVELVTTILKHFDLEI